MFNYFVNIPDDFPGCSHARVNDYFIESINDDCFIAYKKCTDEFDIPVSNRICYICFVYNISVQLIFLNLFIAFAS